MEVNDVLNGAADILEQSEWYNGREDIKGSHCAWSAMTTIASMDDAEKAGEKLLKYLGKPTDRISEIFWWNDGRDNKNVVINTLRNCANAN